jgi:hypothetical protein
VVIFCEISLSLEFFEFLSEVLHADRVQVSASSERNKTRSREAGDSLHEMGGYNRPPSGCEPNQGGQLCELGATVNYGHESADHDFERARAVAQRAWANYRQRPFRNSQVVTHNSPAIFSARS